jgi:lysophospholipase L1-like esterase
MSLRAAVAIAAAALAVAAPAASAATSCSTARWVGAWAASPSDSSRGSDISDLFDPSGNLKSTTRNETTRAILTPSLGGSEVRVHLSNRFGDGPVTFARATVARRREGAALVPGTVVPLTFGGKPDVTVAAGQDAVSDPVKFSYDALEPIAVSVFVAGDIGKPTEHYTARQTSYLTPEDAGDKTADETGASFTQKTTTRPFVSGVDVRAPRGAGAVAAFGDSITDGYQGQPPGVPETTEGIDADGRWPDVLARRMRAAGVPLSSLNAAISGNRVLRDGIEGDNRDTYGPSALKRLDADLLALTGVTTVIWLEGINDLGQDPGDKPDAIIAGYEQGIARMHAAGLRVLMGTLTPASGAQGGHGTAETDANRRQINDWIRTESPADGFVDFDAAVRDPSDASRLDPAYDGSDHLHLNVAGYKAMGDAVPLGKLALAPCAKRLTVRVSPRRITAGRRTLLRVTVTRAGDPVPAARIRIGSLRATTNARGVARRRVRLTKPGRRMIAVRATGATPARAFVRVRRAR